MIFILHLIDIDKKLEILEQRIPSLRSFEPEIHLTYNGNIICMKWTVFINFSDK